MGKKGRYSITWEREVQLNDVDALVGLINGDESITEDGVRIESLTVWYNFSPGCPGTWEDPPEPDEMEITFVENEEGEEVKLTDEEYQAVEQMLYEKGGDDDDFIEPDVDTFYHYLGRYD